MTPNLLTVPPSLGIANLQEFISAAKASNELKVVIPVSGGFHSESRLLKAGRFP